MKKAIVVGGGPAGASAALGLLRAGYSVRVLEQRTTIGPRVCGAFLDSEAVVHVRWLGLEERVLERGAAWVREIRVTTNRGADQHEVLPLPGLSLPRPVLEEILLTAVEAQGGELLRGTRAGVHHREKDGWTVEVPGQRKTLVADLLVRADGRFSGAGDGPREGRGWYGFKADFSLVAQNPGEMSLHFYPGGYVGVLTFADGRTNVCGLHRRTSEPLEWERVFAGAWVQSRALRMILERARRETPWRGVGPIPFTRGLRSSDGVLRVGDAAAVGDPFMGEGIGRALSAGPLIEATFRAARPGQDPLALYETRWRAAYRSRQQVGWLTRSVLNMPRFSSRVIETVLAHPSAMGRLTRLFHGGFVTEPFTPN